jgi:formylglycine-generating enzyme
MGAADSQIGNLTPSGRERAGPGPPAASLAAGSDERHPGMAWIPAGEFQMGSADFYPEERPVHRVAVAGFWMDQHPVTVTEFRRFIKATGYQTVAERPLHAADYPDADPVLLVPGSLVFRRTSGPVDTRDFRQWWDYVPGACWRHPEGPASDLRRRDRHPVTHVAYEDAETYASWVGKALPTEAEWEFAARGGLDGAAYVWGDEFAPDGRQMANTWQGEFPWQNLLLDGYEGTSPAGAFPPNGYGLHDMAGNVWEWTCDYFRPRHHNAADAAPCCMPRNPAVTEPGRDFGSAIPRRVIKGGSHLCAPNYCLRYRPAARQGEAVDSSAGHLGFRCIARPADRLASPSLLAARSCCRRVPVGGAFLLAARPCVPISGASLLAGRSCWRRVPCQQPLCPAGVSP